MEILYRQHPDTSPQFLISRPRPSRLYALHHPQHTNTKEILVHNLPFFIHYTYYATTNENQPNLHVDDYCLFRTLSWTLYYHFINQLALTLNYTPDNNELCQSSFHKLTIALHEKQFTTIGLKQTLNRFIAQRATDSQKILMIMQ